jgi:hypothetical protein
VGVGALIESLRGGQSAGDALAALIFGHFSPSGRMPCAVVGTATGLRPYAEMDFTKGRGCRYAHVSALPPPPPPPRISVFIWGWAQFHYMELLRAHPRQEHDTPL